MSKRLAFFVIGGVLAGNVSAGARIDLRPTPPIPEFGYDLNQVVNVDLILVDNATGQNTSFTGIQLSSSATDPHLTVGPTFNWINPGNIGSVFSMFPSISWVYPLPTPNPALQITLPNGGEVKLGDFALNVGSVPGVFELNLLSGAQFSFTGGGPWTDLNGQITGGVEQIPVAIPEPATCLLLVATAIWRFTGRSRCRILKD